MQNKQNKHVTVRFFFCVPGTEGAPCATVPVENVIGEADFENVDDEMLRREVHRLIMCDDSRIEKTKTHTVVADVGVDKNYGGLGASQPLDTVILYRP